MNVDIFWWNDDYLTQAQWRIMQQEMFYWVNTEKNNGNQWKPDLPRSSDSWQKCIGSSSKQPGWKQDTRGHTLIFALFWCYAMTDVEVADTVE